MKKFGLTLALLFSPVAPVLGGQIVSAQDSSTLTVQMPSANDQAPGAQPKAATQPATASQTQPPKDEGQSQPAQPSQPAPQDQPAAAPAQAPVAQNSNPQDATAQSAPAPDAQAPADAQWPAPVAAGQAATGNEPTATATEQTAAAEPATAKNAKASMAEEIVAAAERQADLLGGQPGVFELDVNFAATMNRAMAGHLELRWESKDHWWRHIEMDNFTQTMMRNGGKIYTSSNVHYVPAEVTELINLLGFAEDEASRGEIAVTVQNERKELGVRVQCIQTALKQLDNQPDEVCLSATSHDILSDDWRAAPDQRRKAVFTHYMAFGNYRYPSELELAVNGKKVLVANVTNLSATPFDESLLDPLKKLMQPQAPSLSIAEAK
jgi:hypothetical protein